MGNYIHHVPSNSHTSGATVRDSNHAAALPARNSGSQGLKQEPQHCPCCPPECPSIAHTALLRALALPRLPSHSCHGALALLAQGELQLRSLGKQLLPPKAHLFMELMLGPVLRSRSHVAPTFRPHGGSPT